MRKRLENEQFKSVLLGSRFYELIYFSLKYIKTINKDLMLNEN
jgi:hypothetical protein